MAIHDADPEKRNLMVTSVAFIVYFCAGGSFPDNTVRLQVINAEFSSPVVLALIAWVIFFWFLYRYWVTHKDDFTQRLREEFAEWRGKKYISNYASKRIDQEPITDQEEGYHVAGIAWVDRCVHISLLYAKGVKRNPDGSVLDFIEVYDSSSSKKKHHVEMNDLRGWFLAIKAIAECIAKYPTFSSYVVPYIISGGAMVAGLLRLVFW